MPTNSQPPTLQNQLLAALPRKEYQRLIPHLEFTPPNRYGVFMRRFKKRGGQRGASEKLYVIRQSGHQ